jgi:hypothetical protein
MQYIIVVLLGAVYYTLGNIDPALRSRVEAIHLLCLFPCELLERYTFDDIMRPFIEEVKQLNEVLYELYSN